MRRNMQNISFLAIIGALLSCAFFFSQQTQSKLADQQAADMQPAAFKVETLADIPECPATLGAANTRCYQDAAEAADQLMSVKVEAILAVETDSQKRMDLLSAQQAWEESRDLDCSFIRELVEDPNDRLATERQCSRDYTLSRITTLDALLCQYYDADACLPSNIAAP